MTGRMTDGITRGILGTMQRILERLTIQRTEGRTEGDGYKSEDLQRLEPSHFRGVIWSSRALSFPFSLRCPRRRARLLRDHQPQLRS